MPAPNADATTTVESVPGPKPGQTTVTVTTYTDETKTTIKSVEIRTGDGDADGAWDRYKERVIEHHNGDHVTRVIEVGVTWRGNEPHVGLRTIRFNVLEVYAYPRKWRSRELVRITQDKNGQRICFVTESWHDGKPRKGLCFTLPFGVPEPHYWPHD